MFLYFLFPGCMIWMPAVLGGYVWIAYRYLPPPLQALFGVVVTALAFWPLNHWPAAIDTW